MEKENFKDIVKELSNALIDDFRGFLKEGVERVEVPDDMYHLQIAMQEMSKEPNWKYESGTGQNPIIDFLKEKKSLYITRISLNKENTKFQRTVGYLTDVYSDEIEYKGQIKKEYEVLREMAIGMGYDVDEYTVLKDSNSNVKTPVRLDNYKGETKIKKCYSKNITPHRKLSEGDKPIFDNDGKLLGFMSNGRFASANNYIRYAQTANKRKNKKNSEEECK